MGHGSLPRRIRPWTESGGDDLSPADDEGRRQVKFYPRAKNSGVLPCCELLFLLLTEGIVHDWSSREGMPTGKCGSGSRLAPFGIVFPNRSAFHMLRSARAN